MVVYINTTVGKNTNYYVQMSPIVEKELGIKNSKTSYLGTAQIEFLSITMHKIVIDRV
jgi:hypothetical protein